MNLIKYEDSLSFQSAVQDYLLIHETENNLPLGILSNIIAGEYLDKPPYLSLVEEDGEVLLVVMRTPPFPALFSFEEKPLDEEVINLVIEDLWKTFGSELTSLTGNKKLVAPLTDTWQNTTGLEGILKMAMRIYKLEQVIPVSNVPGGMRPAIEKDESLILEWFEDFYREALREEPTEEQVKTQAETYLMADPLQRGLLIWEDGGKPVSMAGYTGPTTNGIRIGAVYTPPALRRRGYASACVANTSQHLLDLGFQFCFLFTDLLNPTSNHIYQQVGLKPVNDVDTYEFIERQQ
ncbi:MAG: GNAT family N-acetyltransferase [Anaerolineales bacterium]